MVLLKILVVKSNHTSKIISLEYICGSGITYWKDIKNVKAFDLHFYLFKIPFRKCSFNGSILCMSCAISCIKYVLTCMQSIRNVNDIR